jgi:hypothetical protein
MGCIFDWRCMAAEDAGRFEIADERFGVADKP